MRHQRWRRFGLSTPPKFRITPPTRRSALRHSALWPEPLALRRIPPALVGSIPRWLQAPGVVTLFTPSPPVEATPLGPTRLPRTNPATVPSARWPTLSCGAAQLHLAAAPAPKHHCSS